MKNDEMGETCSMYGEVKIANIFVWKASRKETTWEL